MNRAFIVGFFDELEKQGFFGKKEVGQAQRTLKEIQRGLSKQPHIETVPAGSGLIEEKPIRPGMTMESAKSMAGDVARKVKNLKPVRRKAE